MSKTFKNWILLVLLVSAIAFWQAIFTARSDRTCVWFLDIGEGDAAYIRAQDGADILIDGGPNDKVLDQLQKVMPWMDKKLDLMVATHADRDHIGGLDEVLENYAVKEIWWNGQKKDNQTFKIFWQAVENEVNSSGAMVLVPKLGQTKFFGKDKFQLIYARRKGDSNERSLVTMLTEPSTDSRQAIDFLFTADLPAKLESNLPITDIEVLKVGHHGSNTSTSGRFLDNFKPEYAVISVGKNHYGHPHQIVLDRLRERGIKILRTDQQGNVGFCIGQGVLAIQ